MVHPQLAPNRRLRVTRAEACDLANLMLHWRFAASALDAGDLDHWLCNVLGYASDDREPSGLPRTAFTIPIDSYFWRWLEAAARGERGDFAIPDAVVEMSDERGGERARLVQATAIAILERADCVGEPSVPMLG